MSSDRRNVLRAPTRDDLYQGGRKLLQLLDTMPEHTSRGCRFSIVQNRAEMMMVDASGAETVGRGWTVMDIVGASLFLSNLNHAPEERSLAPGMGEEAFLIDARWGVLPPGMAGLHCVCGILPGPQLCLHLSILTEEELRERSAALADAEVTVARRLDLRAVPPAGKGSEP